MARLPWRVTEEIMFNVLLPVPVRQTREDIHYNRPLQLDVLYILLCSISSRSAKLALVKIYKLA